MFTDIFITLSEEFLKSYLFVSIEKQQRFTLTTFGYFESLRGPSRSRVNSHNEELHMMSREREGQGCLLFLAPSLGCRQTMTHNQLVGKRRNIR